MIQIETIKWLPYPEYKPETNQALLVKDVNGAYWTCRYISIGGKMLFYSGVLHIEAEWWAIIPSPRPEAKTFNFQTALELMKQGKICKPVGVMETFVYTIRDGCFYSKKDGYLDVTVEIIESDWELADE